MKESYASNMLENINSEEDEFVAKWSATSLYLGGVDTVTSYSLTVHTTTDIL